MAKVLIIAPNQNVFPPRNGGHLRTANLSAEIARHHDTHYLSLQRDAHTEALAWDHARCKSIHFHYSNPIHPRSLFPRIVSTVKFRWHAQKLSAPTNSAILSLLRDSNQLLSKEGFDCIFLISIPPLLFQRLKKKYSIPIIYDAHNVDSVLIKQQLDLQSDKKAQKALRVAYQDNIKKETTLYRYCDSTFACSQLDKEQLDHLNQGKLSIYTIPNGVDSYTNSQHEPATATTPNLLFCGSLDYFPNKEGLLWFHQQIWPKLKASLPSVQLTLIGRTHDQSATSSLKDDPQIKLISAVDDVRPYYKEATVSIVPLNIGSGTRLKILESMSLGIPVISTSKGAEGIQATHGTHITIADQALEFHDQLLKLLSDSKLRKAQSHNARKLVEEKYDWQVIGQQADTAILQSISLFKSK